jgi:hypothetical protein
MDKTTRGGRGGGGDELASELGGRAPDILVADELLPHAVVGVRRDPPPLWQRRLPHPAKQARAHKSVKSVAATMSGTMDGRRAAD